MAIRTTGLLAQCRRRARHPAAGHRRRSRRSVSRPVAPRSRPWRQVWRRRRARAPAAGLGACGRDVGPFGQDPREPSSDAGRHARPRRGRDHRRDRRGDRLAAAHVASPSPERCKNGSGSRSLPEGRGPRPGTASTAEHTAVRGRRRAVATPPGISLKAAATARSRSSVDRRAERADHHRHILPNVLSPIMVSATLGVADAIITELALSSSASRRTSRRGAAAVRRGELHDADTGAGDLTRASDLADRPVDQLRWRRAARRARSAHSRTLL